MKMKAEHCIGLSAAGIIAALLLCGPEVSAQDAKKAVVPTKAASACKGLDEKICKGKTAECLWIVPGKGKQKPYCRLKPSSKKTT